MFTRAKTTKQDAPRDLSRAAQNRKIRQDALREELASRNYISQLQKIADRLDPDSKEACKREDVPMVKERVGIRFRMFDKTLPNLKPVELPVTFPLKQSLTDQAASILRAVATGKITPSDAATLMNALSAQARVVDVDDLDKRITKLEQAHEMVINVDVADWSFPIGTPAMPSLADQAKPVRRTLYVCRTGFLGYYFPKRP